MLHLIPEDLSYIVLSKLPVKSLLRFRCVSKLWLNIIDRPCFINMHLNHFKQNSCNTMFVPAKDFFNSSKQTLPMYAFDFDNQDKFKDEAKKILPPVIYDPNCVHTCNGLICVCTGDKIIIWNPATHKHREVRVVKECYFCFGFGYDHKTDDYKVVMLENCEEEKCFVVHVYSLKTGLWRRTGTMNEKRVPYLSVYASGAIHWMTNYLVTKEPLETKRCIDAFDLTTEEWLPRTMPPEPRTTPTHLQCWALSNHQESLCASCYDDEPNLVHLWVMIYEGMKSSWNKMVTVKGNNGEIETTITPLWSLKKNSRQQILLNNYEEQVFYDIEKGTREAFHVHGVSKFYNSFICCESLVPVYHH